MLSFTRVPPASLRSGLRALVSLGFVWWVAWKLDWASVWGILAKSDWGGLSFASSLTLLLTLLLSVRWHIFIRQQGLSLSGRGVFFLTWAAQFFNTILPGNTGGDVVKVFQICRIAPDRKSGAVASVVVDRLAAFAALLSLALFSLSRHPIPSPLEGWKLVPWFSALVVACVLLAVLFGFLLLRRFPVQVRLSKFIAAMKLGARPGIPLAAGLALSLVIHLFSFFHFYLFSRAIGCSITYADTLIFLPVLMVLMMAPITVNGHGLREVVLIYYFQALHIVPTVGGPGGVAEFVVSLSLLMVANELLWSIPGGLIYLARTRCLRGMR